jgi:hypothetical protein
MEIVLYTVAAVIVTWVAGPARLSRTEEKQMVITEISTTTASSANRKKRHENPAV